MQEPGLDKHVWEAEWQGLEPLVVDSPAEALPELDRLVEQMMRARGYPVEEESAWESPDPDVVAEFIEARRITRLVDAGEAVDPSDIGVAITGYRNLYEHLLDPAVPP
jgi:hypothetical protein